jgi:hypothetical protein
VLSVHLSNHVSTATLESLIEEMNFITPAAMGTTLLVRVKKVLPAVEHTIRSSGNSDATSWLGHYMGETGIQSSNFQQARETIKQRGRAAGLEDNLMGEDEHAGFREKVGVHMFRFDDRQHLAVDQVQHLLPGIDGYGFEAVRGRSPWKVSSRCAEPYF